MIAEGEIWRKQVLGEEGCRKEKLFGFRTGTDCRSGLCCNEKYILLIRTPFHNQDDLACAAHNQSRKLGHCDIYSTTIQDTILNTSAGWLCYEAATIERSPLLRPSH